MPIIGPKSVKGTRKGFGVKYKTTTSIEISPGSFEGNGKLYTLSSAATHAMTSLAPSSFEKHYLYINASTGNFYNSTTAPVYSIVKNGWYNGNDVLVFGGLASKPSAAELEYFFTTYFSDRYYRITYTSDNFELLNGLNPDGNWQSTTTESSVYLPVNATEALIRMYNTDAGADVKLSWLNSEAAALDSNIYHSKFRQNGYNVLSFSCWGGMGDSLDMKVGGGATNDNLVNVILGGAGCNR